MLLEPLSAPAYLWIGLSLAAVKYGVELALIAAFTGNWLSPVDFVMPVWGTKEALLLGAPPWVGGFILSWSLPFAALAMLFSTRRCFDAGINPWWSLMVLCPVVNVLAFLVLVTRPSRRSEPAIDEDQTDSGLPPRRFIAEIAWSLVLAMALGAGMLFFSVYVLHEYGTGLFFSTPMVMGAIAGYRVGRIPEANMAHAVGSSLLVGAVALTALLLAGLEGAICLIMALPLVAVGAAVGGAIGYSIAYSAGKDAPLAPALAMLPLAITLESAWSQPVEYVVATSIQIEASLDDVWEAVIAFPPIDEPPNGMFRWGLAYPVAARLEGRGVGALRFCEFSTGPFVEPITCWDAPYRLSFDVADQPPPLVEWSPYASIHPPHLDHMMRSQRGEFRLTRLADGRTQLEGRTWYTVDAYPQHYWRLWTDRIVHAIHLRVLDHIRRTAESANGSAK